MELTRDFKEFIRLLNKHKVRYLLLGGYAVAAHGYPRYTGDIDIWVDPTHGKAAIVLKVLKEFGFDSLQIDAEDLTKEDLVIQLGYPPNRIDLLTGASGLAFEECWKEKEEMHITGETIYVISLRHLKINKQKTDRDKDRDDLKNLP